MNEVLQLAKEEIKIHRIGLLKYSLIVAVVCSLISLLCQQFNNNIIPLLVTLIINLIFLTGMNSLYLKALHHQSYNFRDFRIFQQVFMKIFLLFAIYLGILLLGVGFIRLLMKFQTMVFLLPAIIAMSVIAFNCINHLTLFLILQDQYSVIKALKEGCLLFVRSKKLILHITLKTILLILLGSFAIYALNVFVYAPQIDAVLKSTDFITEAMIDPFFSTNLSYLIQSIGMQLVVSYLAVVSGLTYGAYYCQKRKGIQN